MKGRMPPGLFNDSIGLLRVPLLTEGQTAEFLQVSAHTLRYWRKRAERRGPAWIKIERAVRYRLEDLLVYLRKRTVRTEAQK